MNPISSMPKAAYVQVRTHDGYTVPGMKMGNGNILVRIGDTIGEATPDQFEGWME